MGDKWSKAYDVVRENFGWSNVPRHLNEEDPFPQQGQPQQQQAPAPQGGDMGDMNQEEQPQRAEGQWDDDIKSQVVDMAGKSLKDLYNGLEDDQAKTDFVKNVAGPGIKAQLGIDNIPYKELHGILASQEGEEQPAPDEGQEMAPETEQPEPQGGGAEQLNQGTY
jgi:hypothetical protein